jgi:N-acetylglutamate synthase/N-acetylornithine aminotransferase
VTAALGRSGAQLEEEKLDVFMGTIQVLKNGAPVPFDKSSKRSMFSSRKKCRSP